MAWSESAQKTERDVLWGPFALQHVLPCDVLLGFRAGAPGPAAGWDVSRKARSDTSDSEKKGLARGCGLTWCAVCVCVCWFACACA